MTIKGDTSSAVGAIADGVDAASIAMAYPDAVGAIVNQHGFNLLWFGFVTVIAAVYIRRKNRAAIFIAALVGGLADLGYFVFLDLGGFVNFVPGTVMALMSSAAVVLSVLAYAFGLRTTRQLANPA